MSKVYPALLERLTIREAWISNDSLKFIYPISIEISIRNTSLKKFLQTDILFDQFKGPTIQFRKCFAVFNIPKTLFKEYGSSKFVTIIIVI